MAEIDGDRTRHFPAIEKKHGGPISVWLERIAALGEAKYPEQIAYLREDHGFSQTHANALVMYHRGSTTSKRFATPNDYFETVDKAGAVTSRKIFDVAMKGHPDFELVVAWNHPVLRTDGKYVFGLAVARAHITVNPFSGTAITSLGDRLDGLRALKKTFKVPLDWKIDVRLVRDLVDIRLSEIH